LPRMKRTGSHLTSDEIIPGEVVKSVADEGAGGIVLFLGTVRNRSEAGNVTEILYEAYPEMAEKKLVEIENHVRNSWPVKKIRIVHRIGRLRLGEVSVAVAVASPHRAEAFDACRHAIDNIKRDVPIWKKEKLVGGKEEWVEGHPIRGPTSAQG
jgi:molybdopterin synthase catalytic subunit